MSRLSLIIADSDKEYMAKFEKFLIINYPQRFDIFYFSSPEKLSEFLSSPEKRDILLINSQFYKKELQLKNIEAVIFLSGDSAEAIPEGVETLCKYQHAERLVTDILRYYAANSRKACMMPKRDKSRVVCTFSSEGGAGKTSIAAGCSILCSRRGLKTFYLNLEDIPSTNLFFNGETEQSLSNMIYHLKGKDDNLVLKLEGAKCCDSKNGVHFFAPPDSILDMEELSDHDVVRLVNSFKAGTNYDYIFIDMPCGLNKRNAALLGSADIILLVLAPGDASDVKMNGLKTGIDMLENKYGMELNEKIITVFNKWDKKVDGIVSAVFTDNKKGFEIGECAIKGANRRGTVIIDNVAFLSRLNKLLDYFLTSDLTISQESGGGESIA